MGGVKLKLQLDGFVKNLSVHKNYLTVVVERFVENML